jgi:hypothetical protein
LSYAQQNSFKIIDDFYNLRYPTSCRLSYAQQNSFKIIDDFYNRRFILPLVGGVLLPGLPKLELGVCGPERAFGVQRDQIAGLSNRLGGVDGASDLRKNKQIHIAKTTFESFFLLPIG